MFSCALCENETVIVTSLCPKCRRIKHLINLYGDKVFDVLENVLVCSDSEKLKKVKQEISTQKEKFEKRLTK